MSLFLLAKNWYSLMVFVLSVILSGCWLRGFLLIRKQLWGGRLWSEGYTVKAAGWCCNMRKN